MAFNQLKSYNPMGNIENLQRIDLQDNFIEKFENIVSLSGLPK